jgi:hypothetical protein
VLPRSEPPVRAAAEATSRAGEGARQAQGCDGGGVIRTEARGGVPASPVRHPHGPYVRRRDRARYVRSRRSRVRFGAMSAPVRIQAAPQHSLPAGRAAVGIIIRR